METALIMRIDQLSLSMQHSRRAPAGSQNFQRILISGIYFEKSDESLGRITLSCFIVSRDRVKTFINKPCTSIFSDKASVPILIARLTKCFCAVVEKRRVGLILCVAPRECRIIFCVRRTDLHLYFSGRACHNFSLKSSHCKRCNTETGVHS